MSDMFAPAPAKVDPRVHLCTICKAPNASCGVGSQLYCATLPCRPRDFFPADRGPA